MDSRALDIFVKILLEIDEIEARKREFHIDAGRWRASRPMRDMILMPLIQIGELTTHFKNSEHLDLFPEIPWREIKGFRNVVVHGYGQIDSKIAWNTATDGIAELRAALLGNADIAQAYEVERGYRKTADDCPVPSSDIDDLIQGMPEPDVFSQ